MALLTIVQPALEPVSLADIKAYGRVSTTADDALLTSLISAAREWSEIFCERRFIFRTQRLQMDFFPGYIDFKLAGQKVSSPFVSGSNAVLVGIRYAILLPYPIVRQIVALRYLAADGTQKTLTPGVDYLVDLDSQPARLTPNVQSGAMWPVALVTTNAVQVDYVTGSSGPITVGMTAASAVIASTFNFLQRDVGTILTIPGAGPAVNGVAGTLTASIASVDANGHATLATAAGTTVANVAITWGNVPEIVKTAIKALALYWYENRLPDTEQVPKGVKAMLYPHRDLRF